MVILTMICAQCRESCYTVLGDQWRCAVCKIDDPKVVFVPEPER